MPPRSSQPPASPKKPGKSRPRGLLNVASEEDVSTKSKRRTAEEILSVYEAGKASPVPELPETAALRERLSLNVAFFLEHVSRFLEKYRIVMAELQRPGGVRDVAQRALDDHPTHPVGRVIRLPVPKDEDEEKTEAAAATTTTAEGAEVPAPTDDGDDDDDDSDASSEAPEPSSDAPEIDLPDNTSLMVCLQDLKKEAYELRTIVEGISDWISLNLPILEDGIADETGITIMAAVLEKATTFATAIQLAYQLDSTYLDGRAMLEIAVEKYPDSPATLLRLIQLDRCTWDGLLDAWRTLSRSAILLYADVRNNFSTLRTPIRESDIASAGAYM